MSPGWVAALFLFCPGVVIGLVWAWRRLLRQARIFRRISPALVEWDAFEKLLALRTDRSHFLERHGPTTFKEEQLQRALTGQFPAAGVAGPPVDAGRWRRHQDLLDALEHVQERWDAGGRPERGVFRLRFEELIGDGFRSGCDTPTSTAHVMVIVRKGKVITAFPVIDPDLTAAWEPLRRSSPSA